MHYFVIPHNQLFEVDRTQKLRHREVKYLARLVNVGTRSLTHVTFCLPGC